MSSNETVNNTTRVEQFEIVQKYGLELFKQKNADYGDAFAKYGVIGVLMRMEDKLHRFLNITNTNITLVKSETLHDTLIDLHNYSAMAMMLMNEEGLNHSNSYINNTI